MKRVIQAATVALVACVPMALSGALANAAPGNSTSITLSCDKNVDATVTLTLQPSATDATSLGIVEISCGPNSNVGRQRNRVDVPTGQLAAGWVAVTAWTNSSDTGANGCAVPGALPYKRDCTNAAGTGSQLVVR